MERVANAVVEVLEPLVGRTVADTCVRATALSMGKTADDLTPEDLPALSANIERLLKPVAPRATVEATVAEIGRRVA